MRFRWRWLARDLEILELRGESSAKDGADFLRPGAVAFGGADQLPTGAVGEFDLCRDAVRKRQASRSRPYRLGADPDGTGSEQEAEKVEEVAGFPEHPAAAFGMICEPAGGLERSGHDAEAGGLRSWAARMSLRSSNGRTGEASAEAHLDVAAAGRKRQASMSVSSARVRQERLLHQKMCLLARKGRAEHEWCVQAVTGRDQYRRGNVIDKHLIGIGRGYRRETELRTDVVRRAQCRLRC